MTSAPHLLIVDDDLTTLKMLHKALEGMGEVHTASSGAQALQIVAEHPIDLVLLDIIMPEMDGFATCRALLQTQPDMTVLFVTVVSDTGSEVAALEVGGRDFISKPINPPVVRARVALHLKLKAQHRERRAMEEAIRALNANLEQQVERRTADLRATNAALRESEERYRLLFDNIAGLDHNSGQLPGSAGLWPACGRDARAPRTCPGRNYDRGLLEDTHLRARGQVVARLSGHSHPTLL